MKADFAFAAENEVPIVAFLSSRKKDKIHLPPGSIEIFLDLNDQAKAQSQLANLIDGLYVNSDERKREFSLGFAILSLGIALLMLGLLSEKVQEV